MSPVRLVRWLGTKPLFAWIGRRTSPLDTWIYRRTKGRFGLLGPVGMIYPLLLLTTTGRRTGKRRTTPVMYVRQGTSIVISSENFGQRREAAWPLNLKAHPRAEVQIAGETFTCRARLASESELEQFWPRLVALWPAHQHYIERTGVRNMFVLEPQ